MSRTVSQMRAGNDDAADYLELNRRSWDERVGVHVASGFYAVDRFVEHQDGRVAEQRGGQAEPLLHAE